MPTSLLTRLPAELLLKILDHLPPEAFIAFAISAYPLFAHHNIAPRLHPTHIRSLNALAAALASAHHARLSHLPFPLKPSPKPSPQPPTSSAPPPATAQAAQKVSQQTSHHASLPAEINLQILTCLRSADVMRFVMADYGGLMAQGIAPAMTEGIVALISGTKGETGERDGGRDRGRH